MMSCTHIFFGYQLHLENEYCLLPVWDADTLIIGTFNPELKWHPKNTAQYFYGRTRNYLWRILPCFAGEKPIAHKDVDAQIDFLKRNRIAITDLLISIDDADIKNVEHAKRIQTVLDNEIELFERFTWNTENITKYIKQQNIKAVYFTKLGNVNQVTVKHNTFEEQMRKIETLCGHLKIPVFRLHTPTGQGLGGGKPRNHKLIHRWFKENGGSRFPFLIEGFNLELFPVAN